MGKQNWTNSHCGKPNFNGFPFWNSQQWEVDFYTNQHLKTQNTISQTITSSSTSGSKASTSGSTSLFQDLQISPS